MLFNSVSNNILIRQVSGEEPNVDSSTNLLSERRTRRRHYTLLDEDCESHDELINPQEDLEYFDFRSYPLNINWKDLDSLQNDAYEIKDEFGLIGVSIYFAILACHSLEKNFKLNTPEKFVANLIEFYFNCFEKSDSEAIQKLSDLVIKCLPDNEKILLIINKNFIAKKEYILIKLVLDLKLHFYLNFDKLNLKGIYNILKTMKVFYRFVSNENIRKIHEKLKEDKLFKKYYQENILLNFSKKSNYFLEIKKLKTEYKDLFGGIDIQKFYM